MSTKFALLGTNIEITVGVCKAIRKIIGFEVADTFTYRVVCTVKEICQYVSQESHAFNLHHSHVCMRNCKIMNCTLVTIPRLLLFMFSVRECHLLMLRATLGLRTVERLSSFQMTPHKIPFLLCFKLKELRETLCFNFSMQRLFEIYSLYPKLSELGPRLSQKHRQVFV